MRVMQIGVGGFGNCWLKTIQEEPRAEMVALVDLSRESLDKACETCGHSADICYTDLDKALAEVTVDLAVVVTPPVFHRQPVVTCLEAGLDVISEKPMAESMDDCYAMMEASKRTGNTYIVSQNYRFRPAIYKMAEMVRNGLVGDIGQVKIDFYKGFDFGGGFRHEMDYPLLVDMTIHHVDMIRFITGLNPVEARGFAWNPPWSNYRGDCSSSVVFTMTDDVPIVYNASWCAKGDYCDWNGNWQIEGSKGTILYRDGEVTLVSVPGLYEIESRETVQPADMPRTDQGYVLDSYIDHKADGTDLCMDCFDNIHSIGMVFAAVEAVKSGKVVPVLDEKTRRLIARA